MFHASRVLALAGVSALAMSAAHAQTTPAPAGSAAAPAVVLPPVTVDAPSQPRARPRPVVQAPVGAPYVRRAQVRNPDPLASAGTPLDEPTVTSTKVEAPAIDTLAGASVVTGEQLQRIQPDRVSDILKQVPGVATQENPNNPAQSINIRGLQDFGRVNVLIDGARQNFTIGQHGAQGVFYLDPELIGGVDITRGPVSTIYGSGAIGGVVNFRTRGVEDILKPDETAGVVQKIGFGTNGYGILNSTSLGARLPNNAATAFGQFVYRDQYVYRDGAGFLVPDTGNELRSGNVKLTLNPAEGHAITATALIQKFDFVNNGSASTSFVSPGTASAGSRFADAVDTQTYTLGYRYTPVGNPFIDLSVKGYYSTTVEDETLRNPTASFSALGARAGNTISVDLKTAGFDVFNTSRFDTGPVSHVLTIGGDGVFDNVRTSDQAGGYTAAFTPTGRRDLLGAFLQDEMRYGGWLRAVGAVRYDSYSLSGNDVKSDGDRVSPRGTIGVSPFPWLEIFGTYAEGYRAPTTYETLIAGIHPFPAFTILPNPNLKPETAHNVEGGVNLKFDNVLRAGDVFRGKIVGFSNRVDNFIDIGGVGPVFYVNAIAGANPALCAGRTTPFVNGRAGAICVIGIQNQQYNNIARADLSGAEVEGAYDWGTGFMSLAYTHTDGINARTKFELTSISPDRLAGTFGLRFLDNKLTIGTRVIYNDSRKNDPSLNALFPNTKSYALVDLFASYEYSEWLRGDVNLSNIGDVRYLKYLDLDRSPGFQARGSLTFKFATR